MFYIQNGDLHNLIEKRGKGGISFKEMIAWFDGLLSGLVHMHGLYVMHRDIKPCNILFDHGWAAVLGDFGGNLKI